MRILVPFFVFILAFSVFSQKADAFFGGITCPPQYKDLSPAPVDSDLYKGHCGLVVCTNEGKQGLENCAAIQRKAYTDRVRRKCRPVPPTSQCFR